MAKIHPLAVIDPGAELGRDVEVGPFCVVEQGAAIGDRCRLASHVVVRSGVILGSDNQISEGAVIGGKPQHAKAGPKVGSVRIGNENIIREHATIHAALHHGEETMIGDHNLMMVNTHVGHDCRIGSHVTLVNNAMLGGHVTIQDRATVSGAVGVHQFCRVGKLAMLGAIGRITQDVPPYVLVDSFASRIVGLNVIGLRRNGFSSDAIAELKAAYRLIYRSGLPWTEMLDALASQFPDGPAAEFRTFFAEGQRGFLRERASTLSVVSEHEDGARSRRRLGRAA